MNASSRFSVRNLLALTLVVCVALASLVKPSMWWFFFGSALVAAILVRMVVFSRAWRAFGCCFIGGLVAYAWSLKMMATMHNTTWVFEFWNQQVASPLWRGTGPLSSYNAFSCSLLLWTAVVIAGAAAFAVQFIFRRSDGD
jgi:hypothetical protein